MAQHGTVPVALIVVNVDWYFWSHRLPVARALREAGFEVVVAAAPERGFGDRIEGAGFRFVPLRMSRRSSSPAAEIAAFFELLRLYRKLRPDVVHHVAIKPVLYGSIAAQLSGLPAVINAIPGLGHVFVARGARARVLRFLVRIMYRVALAGRATRVIFQNPEDQASFVAGGLVSVHRSVLIRGSGVDVDQFVAAPPPEGVPLIVLASRLLWDKGVGVLVEAARELRRRGLVFRVALVGAPDHFNPNSISEEQLQCWQTEGVVEWWGIRADMADVLREASIVVLPSGYGEGVPKILLEAAASARPIVATDIPGCREIVRHGQNGLLVPPGSPEELAGALALLISDPECRERFGACGRALAVREFAEAVVVGQTLELYRDIVGEQWPRQAKE
jgi:glycosyltransferase involved in cell wall biosynthesis